MRKLKIKWKRLFQSNRLHFSPSDLGVKRNIKHTKMQKISILLKNVLHKSKPENLFNINDEDASSKRSTDISIIVHLLILILILIPYDMFHTKVKKQNKITVSIMRKSGSKTSNPLQKVTEEVKIETSMSQEKVNIQPEKVSDVNKNNLPIKQDKNNITPVVEKGNIVTKETTEKVKKDKKSEIKGNIQPEKVSDVNKNNLPIKQDKNNITPVVEKGNIVTKETTEKVKKDKKSEIKESPKQNNKPEKNINNTLNIDNTQNLPQEENKNNKFADIADINGISSLNEIDDISNSKNLIFAQLHACWTQTQVKSKMPKDIFVTVIITFSPNGTIANYTIENKNYANPQKALAYNVAKDNVKIALEACKSLKGLDVKKYEEWKRTRIEFKYSNIDE